MMKTPYVAVCVIVAAAITFAIQENRIADLRSRLAAAERSAPLEEAGRTPLPESRPLATAPPPPASTRAKVRPEPEPEPGEPEVGNFEKSVRKMWDNPAGKSMMNQGVKMAVAVMYGDFIDSLELTREEADYFRDLLGREVSSQQEIGMRMMGATKEERAELMAEMKRREAENEEAIKTFLNDEEDHERFKAYEARLPERQQLDGLRAAMDGKEAPLDAQTEERLVEAMFRARTKSGAKDLSNLKGMESLNSGNMVQDFEQSWEIQQNSLRKEVDGVLNDKQKEAFFEYQEQMKEFSLMGIKMAEKMMGPEGSQKAAE